MVHGHRWSVRYVQMFLNGKRADLAVGFGVVGQFGGGQRGSSVCGGALSSSSARPSRSRWRTGVQDPAHHQRTVR